MTALNPQARQVLDLMEASGMPPLDEMSVADARTASATAFASLSSKQVKPEEVAEVRELSMDGPAGAIGLRLYRPAGSQASQALPGLVYFHGGGWVICDLDTHDQICRRLCNASGCAVVSVDYRLAPEHKFPAAVDDCFAATCWVADHAATLGINADRLAVGGDSAGGNLSAVVSLMARDAGVPKIRHQLLFCPATDMGGDTGSFDTNGEGYFLTKALMQWFFDHYLNGEQDVANWRASPLRAASHAELPSASVFVIGFDPLRDEGVAYAERLRQAGVAVELVRFDDQIHDFPLMDAVISAADDFYNQAGPMLRKALS